MIDVTAGGVTVNVSEADVLYVPVIRTVWDAATAAVLIVNCALSAPGGIYAVNCGHAALTFEVDSGIVRPGAGARPFRVTDPTVLVPPTTTSGEMVTYTSRRGSTYRIPPTDPLYEATKVTLVNAGTSVVNTGNVTSLAPAGTVTPKSLILATSTFEVVMDTNAPPGGAGEFRVTLPVVDTPPMTFAGENVTDFATIGCTVKVEAIELPLKLAWIVTGVLAATSVVVIENSGEAFTPAATVTLAGTAATAGFELDSDTKTPPVGAGAFRVTRFAVVVWPPITVAGDSVTAETASGVNTPLAVIGTPS